MEVRKLRALVVVLVAMGMLIGQSNASFKDCYAKCFVFCMIEPSQTLCSCTTKCLKECIFNSDFNSSSSSSFTRVTTDIPHPRHDGKESNDDMLSHNFCKLGCALSMCSSLSTKHQPNKEKMDGCVGSCSNKCSKSYK